MLMSRTKVFQDLTLKILKFNKKEANILKNMKTQEENRK